MFLIVYFIKFGGGHGIELVWLVFFVLFKFCRILVIFFFGCWVDKYNILCVEWHMCFCVVANKFSVISFYSIILCICMVLFITRVKAYWV